MTKSVSTSKTSRKQHTPEFREEALQLAEHIGVTDNNTWKIISFMPATSCRCGAGVSPTSCAGNGATLSAATTAVPGMPGIKNYG